MKLKKILSSLIICSAVYFPVAYTYAQQCPGVNTLPALPTQCSSDVNINPNGTIFQISDPTVEFTSIIDANNNTPIPSNETLRPQDTTTYLFVFTNTSTHTTCTISTKINVVPPPKITNVTPSIIEGCAPSYNTGPIDVSGTFSELTWASPSGASAPPLELTTSGTITVTATNAPCGSFSQATIKCTMLKLPEYTPIVTNQPPGLIADCKSCLIDYPKADIINVKNGTVTSRELIWFNAPNPLVGDAFVFGNFRATTDSTNKCGTTTKTVEKSFSILITPQNCEPTVPTTFENCVCSDQQIDINAVRNSSTLIPDRINVEITPHIGVNYTTKTENIISFKVRALEESIGKLTIPYKIKCPSSKTNPIQEKTSIKNITIKIDTCIEDSYKYCLGDTAELMILGTNDNKIVDLKIQEPWKSLFQEPVQDGLVWTVRSIDTVMNPTLYSPLKYEVTFQYPLCENETKTFEEKIALSPNSDCEPQVSFSYRNGNSACVGDSIFFTVSENSPICDLQAIEFESDPDYYSAIKTHEERDTKKRSILKYSFVSYKYYHSNIIKDTIELQLKYKFLGKDSVENLTQYINVNTCPPVLGNPSSFNGSLGDTISFSVVANNPTTDTAKKFECTWSPNPNRTVQLTSIRKGGRDRLWYKYYRTIPSGSMEYPLSVEFNEGDSIRTANLKGNFTLKPIPDTELLPLSTTCCVGDSIAWRLKILNPNLKINASDIDWSASPSTVNFLEQKGNDEFYYYTFAADTADNLPYECKVNYILKDFEPGKDTILMSKHNASPFIRPAIHKAFNTDTALVCTGTEINLMDFINLANINPDPSTIVFGSTPVFTVTSSKTVSVKAQAKYHCQYMDANNGFIDSIHVDSEQDVYLTKPLDYISCYSDSLDLKVASNGRITWIIREPNTSISAKDTVYKDLPSNTPAKIIAEKDATVIVLARNSCPVFSKDSFKLKVNPLPSINLEPQKAECAYTSINLKAPCLDCKADSIFYYIKDLRTNDIEIPITAAEIQDYTVKVNDSLQLRCYAVNTLGCKAWDTTEIKSHPSPVLELSSHTGDSICVPRSSPFQLTVKGADTYKWQLAIPNTSPTLNTTLNKDDTLSVIGTNATYNCHDTLDVFCIVSLKTSGIDLLPNTNANCLGKDIILTSTTLPNTKYTWTHISPLPQKTYSSDSNKLLLENISDSDTGIIEMRAIRHNKCDETAVSQIKIWPTPRPTIISNSPICEGEDLNLEVKSGLPASETPFLKFSWTDKKQNIVSQTASLHIPKAKQKDSGYYKILIYDRTCEALDSVNVKIDIHSIPTFTPQSYFCEQEADTLYASTGIPSISGASYHWFSDGGRNFYSQDSIYILNWNMSDNNQKLFLEIINGSCKDSIESLISVRPIPVFTHDIRDTGLCNTSPLLLTANAEPSGSQYTWYKKTPNLDVVLNQSERLSFSNISDNDTGKYYVTANYMQCMGIEDSFYISVYPLPDLSISQDKNLCDGDSVFLFAESNIGQYFTWNTGATTKAIVATDSGLYKIKCSSIFNCITEDSIRVISYPLPIFKLRDDTTMCRGDELLIQGPENLYSYLWNNHLTSDAIEVSESGTYRLSVQTDKFCSYTDSVNIRFVFCGKLFFPTAFSPNGNSRNDKWGPVTLARNSDINYELYIFNRNGKMVFKTQNVEEHWDGTYKGEECHPGVYTFECKVKYIESGDSYRTNGSITLVR